MKTREQAEARAMELLPDKTGILTVWGKLDVREYERQAFLQCWDEMQQDKQTCGFCVEPNGNQPISEQSEEKVNKSVENKLFRELLNQMHTYAIEAQKDPSNSEVFAGFVKESIERIWSERKQKQKHY